MERHTLNSFSKLIGSKILQPLEKSPIPKKKMRLSLPQKTTIYATIPQWSTNSKILKTLEVTLESKARELRLVMDIWQAIDIGSMIKSLEERKIWNVSHQKIMAISKVKYFAIYRDNCVWISEKYSLIVEVSAEKKLRLYLSFNNNLGPYNFVQFWNVPHWRSPNYVFFLLKYLRQYRWNGNLFTNTQYIA